MIKFTCTAVLVVVLISTLTAGSAVAILAGDDVENATAPKGPGDIPKPDPGLAPGGRNDRLGMGILLYVISLVLIFMEIYMFIDPKQAYLLFRRGIQFHGDVELTDFYLAFLKFSALAGIVIYSALLILTGWEMVLLAVAATLIIGFLLLRFSPPR